MIKSIRSETKRLQEAIKAKERQIEAERYEREKAVTQLHSYQQ